ncbi:MAG: ribbon-helix-helix protein, CopG family [SAR324 cluster bacterium]|nr:ribbon-helix-helix protein, CopG family [SAR324 cluster bacterium]
MRTVQMTMEEELISAVDKMVKKLKTTRSAFTREALKQALERQRILSLEDRHRKGYITHPAMEFNDFEEEQVWVE